ncbi:YfbM family protein [filamentous cyanobacterium LEGE 11480]|uniref:YfbM family protein n=1 Tax=Romeriopsis navalis LEGE 11480 TaxID=2777977 RepID=A0A928VLK8_9CYAN|nr:YfbM family protein [Romeriopsis navalis]MBE9028244.1 YfbM family protein [Romeriopsis navalis LEGE 11480]
MGMCYTLFAVSEAAAQQLLDTPTSIHDFLAEHDGDHDNDAAKVVELEKSWHGLHFALTQSPWAGLPPLNFLLAGQTIGDEDIGYGPARILHADDVMQVEQSLANFSASKFAQNFNLAAMSAADIYPQIWDEPKEDLLTEYQEYFYVLKRFMQLAAAGKQAIVITVR